MFPLGQSRAKGGTAVASAGAQAGSPRAQTAAPPPSAGPSPPPAPAPPAPASRPPGPPGPQPGRLLQQRRRWREARRQGCAPPSSQVHMLSAAHAAEGRCPTSAAQSRWLRKARLPGRHARASPHLRRPSRGSPRAAAAPPRPSNRAGAGGGTRCRWKRATPRAARSPSRRRTGRRGAAGGRRWRRGGRRPAATPGWAAPAGRRWAGAPGGSAKSGRAERQPSQERKRGTFAPRHQVIPVAGPQALPST
jgi:hypothetical protein